MSHKLISNKFLILFPDEVKKGFVVEDLFNKNLFSVSRLEILIEILKFAESPKRIFEIENFLKENFKLEKIDAKKLISSLIENNVLVKLNSNFKKIMNNFLYWKNHGWESAFKFHLITKDYPFLQGTTPSYREIDKQIMEKYERISKPPSIFKIYPTAKRIGLDFKNTLLSKVSFNSLFTNASLRKKKLNKKDISELLYFTFGYQKIIKFHKFDVLLKTSPSGGARHPTEAYILSLKITGIPNGLYHYNVKENSLELLREGNFTKYIKNNIFEWKKINFEPQVVLFITSLFERNRWRYREPRTFRSIFFDIGHLLETLTLLAYGLRAKIHTGYNMNYEEIERFIGINRFKESLFFFCAL